MEKRETNNTGGNNTKALEARKPDAPVEWGRREEIAALASRLQAMLPGRTSKAAALATAQYAAALDANPFRGEIYAYESKGKLVLVEGYKLLVRWARRQCQFYDRYTPLRGDELPDGAIGFRCQVLREDAKEMLQMLVSAGARWDEAFDIVAQSAIGILKHEETLDRHGKPIDPPKGWTWEDVTRKRALKNALNRAYGMPSAREIARETWMVDDVETEPGDWPEGPDVLPAERELIAKANARERQRKPADMDTDEAYLDLFEEPTPQDKPQKVKSQADLVTKFWERANHLNVSREDALALVAELGGDFQAATEALDRDAASAPLSANDRSIDPATVIEHLTAMMEAKPQEWRAQKPSDKAKGLLASKMYEAFDGDDERRRGALAAVTGHSSTKDLHKAWVMALLDAFLVGGDGPNRYDLADGVRAEMQALWRHREIERGQGELDIPF